jgi:hypothetical protein
MYHGKVEKDEIRTVDPATSGKAEDNDSSLTESASEEKWIKNLASRSRIFRKTT